MFLEAVQLLIHVAVFIGAIGLFLWIGRFGGNAITRRIQSLWIRLPALLAWAVAPPLLLMMSAGWPFSNEYQTTMVGFGIVLLGFHFIFWAVGTIWGVRQASVERRNLDQVRE